MTLGRFEGFLSGYGFWGLLGPDTTVEALWSLLSSGENYSPIGEDWEALGISNCWRLYLDRTAVSEPREHIVVTSTCETIATIDADSEPKAVYTGL